MKNQYNHQVTVRLTTDLLDRVNYICEDKMIPRGGLLRAWILEKVREEETKKTK